MAFAKFGSLLPFGGPVLRKEIVANSVTLTAMDAVIIDTDGFVALGTAGAAIFGHAVQAVTFSDVGHNTTGVAGADIGSFVGTFTHASDNETVAQNKAEIDISQFTLYSAETDANLDVTAGTSQLDIHFDLIDEDTLDESTGADTTAQYHSFGADPDTSVSDRAIVNVFESSVFNSV